MTKWWITALVLSFILGLLLGWWSLPWLTRVHKIFQEILPGESLLFHHQSQPEPRIPQAGEVPGFARVTATKFKCEIWLGDLFGYPGVWVNRQGEPVQRLLIADGAKCKQIVIAEDAGTAFGLIEAENPHQLLRLVLVPEGKPLTEIKIEPLECQNQDSTIENLYAASPDGTRLLLGCSERQSDNIGYAWRSFYPCRGTVNGSKVELERVQP